MSPGCASWSSRNSSGRDSLAPLSFSTYQAVTDLVMASLKSFFYGVAPILGVTGAALYERQRALVSLGVLKAAKGRGPGNGVPLTAENVAAVIISVLAARSLSEVDQYVVDLCEAQSEGTLPKSPTRDLWAKLGKPTFASDVGRVLTGKLVENQIAPHLGAKALQKLTRLDIEGWHNILHQGGLAPRTIGHAHRVLSKALSDAESDGLVVRNVCKLRKAPKVAESEMAIVQDVPGLVAKLRGSRLCVPAMVALFTGMRLGEVLALRWGRVDLESKVIQVREALEADQGGYPLQGAQIQGRPPRHHPARFARSRRARAS